MSRQIQIRRGTATENDAFTGAIGEVTMDTTNKTLRVHDGETAGGIKLAKQSEIPTVTSKANTDMDNISTTGKKVISNLSTPDYSAPVSKNWDTTYLADYDCVVNYQTNHIDGNPNVAPCVSSDGNTFTTLRESNAGSGSFKISGEFYVPKGWYWKMVGGRNVDRSLKIFPLKGSL